MIKLKSLPLTLLLALAPFAVVLAATLVIENRGVPVATVRIDSGSDVTISPQDQVVRVACLPQATGTLCADTVTVTPTPVGPPPVTPTTCPASWQGYPWANYARRADRATFPALRRLTGGYVANFPQLLGLAVMVVGSGEYISVQFQALPKDQAGQPADLNGDGVVNAADFNVMLRNFTWIESQSGEGGGSRLSGTYFTISACRGDFRLPPENNLPSVEDPTLNLGCRNIRLSSNGTKSLTSGMSYALNTQPNNSTCALTYGQTYYLNMVTVNPLDGWGVGEHNCVDTVNPRCGVQFQSQ